MDLAPIFIGILLFPSLALVFAFIRKSKIKQNKRMTDQNFVVMNSHIVAVIGILVMAISLIIIRYFTFFSGEIPHIIFYIGFGFFFWLGTYLVIETYCFRVIVKKELITVCKKFRRPFTFTFKDISSVERKISQNYFKTEKMKIKTKFGQRFTVENNEISYFRFMKRLKAEVPASFLHGFE